MRVMNPGGRLANHLTALEVPAGPRVLAVGPAATADSCPPKSPGSAGNEAVMHPVLTPEQALGPARRLDLTNGPVEVHEVGHGRPLLFVHGLMVHAAFWRKVVPSLAEHYRCLVPTLPLGAHRLPMNTVADLAPPAIAELLAELLTDLELHDTVVVGNDTGGAYAQIMAAHHPHRIAGLVLTPCDALEHFWPWHPTRMLRRAPVPRSILGYRMLAKYDIPDEVLASYIAPLRHDERIRRDLATVLAGIHPRHTREAARRLRNFDRPVLLAWDTHDSLFPLADAQHLAALLPQARLELIRNSASYIPEDQPDRLANLITDFLSRPATAQDGRGSSIGDRDPAPVRQENPAEHDGSRHPPTQGLADNG